MFHLVKTLPWLVAGAALYHIGCTFLEERGKRRHALLARNAEREARRRLFFQLTGACQRGMLNAN
jgi:hypothetical protein